MPPGISGEHGTCKPRISVVETTDDLSVAKAIRNQVFVREQGIPAQLDDDGLDDEAIHTLLWLDGKAVGTGRLVLSSKGTGILARIAVLDPYRGRQLGGLIISALEQHAARLCLTRVELCPHAHLEAFYLKLGYHTIGGQHRVGSHQLITMEKTLTPYS